MKQKAMILAAGKGTRLNSRRDKIPKAMRDVAGKPLIGHVLDNLTFLDPKDIIIVIGFMGDMIRDYLGDGYTYAWQQQQLGTAHAVLSAAPLLEGYDGDILIGYGDMPLLTERTYRAVLDTHRQTGADATVLTSIVDPPLPYGRIIRDAAGCITDIVEQKECTPEQALITELNVGVNAYRCPLMLTQLRNLKPAVRSNEYYLTALPPMLCAQGYRVESVLVSANEEIFGVNTQQDLEFAQKVLRGRGAPG
ncbi:MAG: NTP transferase domain-containing protein [Eubacteriales bacterium]|nr:NTP transferase domain-containing protein [Eubacteriales bacterium]